MNPFFVAATTLCGATAGLLAAVYTDEIKHAFPFSFGCCDIIWPAWLFWIPFLIFGAGFATTFWAQNKLTGEALVKLASQNEFARLALTQLEEASGAALRQSVSLEKIIRTLPPDGFLQQFMQLYSTAHALAEECRRPTASQQTIRESALLALVCVASVAAHFEGFPPGVRYFANIMLFRPIELFDDASWASISATLMFAEQGLKREALCGVLELIPSLAAGVEGNPRNSLEPKLEPLCLPMPRRELRQDAGRTTVLPGAPQAFLEDSQYDFRIDSAQMRRWCAEHSALRPGVADELEKYFSATGQGAEIRSFASFPLRRLNARGGIETSVGVLNIHSSKTGIFESRERLETLFLPIIRPFQAVLCDILLSTPQPDANTGFHRSN